jgi:5-methyltetrahydropteroyltriglutamate--homocysteine methyltransferase
MPSSLPNFTKLPVYLSRIEGGLQRRIETLKRGLGAKACILVLLSDGEARIEGRDGETALSGPSIAWRKTAGDFRLVIEAGASGYVAEIAEETLARAIGDFFESAAIQLLFDRDWFRHFEEDRDAHADVRRHLESIRRELAQPQPASGMMVVAHLRIVLVTILRALGAEEVARVTHGNSAHYLQRFRQLLEAGFRAHHPVGHYASPTGRNCAIAVAGPPLRAYKRRIIISHVRENTMTVAKPPYRADHVGSLLRPEPVKAARKKFYEDKSISADELKAVEDAGIVDLIKMQEDVGLKAVTDGEIRRSFWHYDFMGMLTGLDLEERDEGVQFAGVKLRPIFPTITKKLDFPDDHPMIEHFKFVAENTKVTPKISIPGPSCCHFRTAVEDITRQGIQGPAGPVRRPRRDLRQGGQGVLRRRLPLSADGRYLLCLSLRSEAPRRQEGSRPGSRLADRALRLDDARGDQGPSGRHGHRHAHVPRQLPLDPCRRRRLRPAAEAIFSTGVDIFFMEYDTDRAGGLEPLKLLPEGQAAGSAGLHHHQGRRSGKHRLAEAEIRRSLEILRHRPARHRAAMRLRLHRGRQRHHL